VAALDFDRSEKEKRLGRQSAEVGQELNPDHVAVAQRPVGQERLLLIHAPESRTIGADATYSLGVQVPPELESDGVRDDRSLSFSRAMGTAICSWPSPNAGCSCLTPGGKFCK